MYLAGFRLHFDLPYTLCSLLSALCPMPYALCSLLLERSHRAHRLSGLLVGLGGITIAEVLHHGAVLSFFSRAPVSAFGIFTQVFTVLIDDVEFIFGR